MASTTIVSPWLNLEFGTSSVAESPWTARHYFVTTGLSVYPLHYHVLPVSRRRNSAARLLLCKADEASGAGEVDVQGEVSRGLGLEAAPEDVRGEAEANALAARYRSLLQHRKRVRSAVRLLETSERAAAELKAGLAGSNREEGMKDALKVGNGRVYPGGKPFPSIFSERRCSSVPRLHSGYRIHRDPPQRWDPFP